MCSFNPEVVHLTFLEDDTKHDCEGALIWSKNNKIVVNPNKCQATSLNKSKKKCAKETMNIGNKKIKSLFLVKLLRIEIEF